LTKYIFKVISANISLLDLNYSQISVLALKIYLSGSKKQKGFQSIVLFKGDVTSAEKKWWK